MAGNCVVCTTQEVSALLGITVKNVLERAKRENWQSIQRPGRGGGKLWIVASMPKATRELIASGLLRQQYATHDEDNCAIVDTVDSATVVTAPAPVQHIDFTPAPSAAPLFPGASDRERAVATARLAFVREIERVSGIIGKEGAIRHLVDCSRLGNLPSILMEQISTATACKRGGTLTRRTLYRWMADYAERGETGLLPSQSKVNPVPAWFDDFLRHYQKPQHPSVALAYSDFCKELAARGEVNPPSIHAVRRLLAKMRAPEREAGRATGNALLKLRPYQRRDTSELWPGDVYTADGTTFDAEVLHPGNGQPFKPEVTAVLDVATRRCVGLSISLSESRFTVLDALRMACCFGGIPAMFYTDSGPGYLNRLLLDDRTGMFRRLGIEPCRAIPGRPQGKGLMERGVKTLWVRAAQGLESYTGALMDGDAAHRNFRRSRAALKAGKRAVLPTWDEFKRHVLARVEEYNSSPHKGLPRYRDSLGRMRHYSPDEYWRAFEARGFAPVRVPEGMESELFMPGERRKCRNGWVLFQNGNYFAPELADYHDEFVEVRYDIWDSARVWCWTLDGRHICEAALEGNTRPYVLLSQVEAAREKRAKAQVGRINDKLQRVAPGAEIILPEPDATPALDVADSTRPCIDLTPAPAAAPVEAEPEEQRPALFASQFDRFRWLRRHPEQQTEVDAAFIETYRKGEEYADMHELLEIEGID